MYLSFGMAVTGADGIAAGTLDRVLIDPATREVTHVVVRPPRLEAEVLLPLNLVQANTADRLLLRAASGDLEQMPRYYEGPATTPPSGRVDPSSVGQPPDEQFSLEQALGVTARMLELGPDTRVAAPDQPSGQLLGLTADQYLNRLSELHVAGPGQDETVVPETQVGELRPGWIGVTSLDE